MKLYVAHTVVLQRHARKIISMAVRTVFASTGVVFGRLADRDVSDASPSFAVCHTRGENCVPKQNRDRDRRDGRGGDGDRRRGGRSRSRSRSRERYGAHREYARALIDLHYSFVLACVFCGQGRERFLRDGTPKDASFALA